MRNGREMVFDGQIILSGYVVADADAAWFGGIGYFCPQMVREALSTFSERAVIRLSSDGGDPFAGEAIRSMIAQHSGGVEVVVEGIAASAASLIFMGAAKRMMSQGSLLMIHDPSTMIWGTEDELRKQADVTGQLADTYAGVYAAAAGISSDQARQIMKAETWFDATQAIAAGFCDEVLAETAPPEATSAAMTMDAARAAFARMNTGMAAMMAARKHSGAPAPGQSAAAGGQPATLALSQEAEMPEVITTPAAASVAAAAPAALAIMAVTPEEATVAERIRQTDIRTMSRPFVASGALTAAEVEVLCNDGTPAAMAGQRFLASMAAAQAPVMRSGIVRDEVDTRREGMEAALVAQFTRKQPTTDKAASYMSMSLVEMAAAAAGYNGALRTSGDKVKAMMAGTHTTSDYTGIFENALNKALLDRYKVSMPTYRRIARLKNFNDFRVHPMVRAGDFRNLMPIGQGGEIKFSTFGEKRETAILLPYGVGLNLTRQMFVDDDTGAITDMINDYGSRIALFEEATFYAFMASAVLASDGLAIWLAAATRGFTAAGNFTSTGTAISIASLSIGQAAMRKQTGIDGEKLNLTPAILLVGPDKEIEAKQLVTQITPALAGSANPFAGQLEVVVTAEISNNNWYLFANPAMPGGQCFVYGYLNGAEAPRLRTYEPFGIQGWSMTLEHDFGLGAVDFRGAFKNNGA